MRLSPSDRIGSNFTPTAKHLSISGLREFRRKFASQRREMLALLPKEASPVKKQKKRPEAMLHRKKIVVKKKKKKTK